MRLETKQRITKPMKRTLLIIAAAGALIFIAFHIDLNVYEHKDVWGYGTHDYKWSLGFHL